jgi:hypothetical protein
VVVGKDVPVTGRLFEAGVLLDVLLLNVGTDEGPSDGLPVGVVSLAVGAVSPLLGTPVVGRALESVTGKTELGSPVGVDVGTTLLLP